MDARAAKLALARKKLKDHQEKKSVPVPKEENLETCSHEPNQNLIQESTVRNEHPVQIVDDTHDFEKVETEMKRNMIEPEHSMQNNISQHVSNIGPDVNVTEILISNKRNLEIQIYDLQTKLSQLEYEQSVGLNNYSIAKQKINYLENELKNINSKFEIASHELQVKEKTINELCSMKTTLSDENNNLQEQLKFTKTILTAKETENASLHSQLGNLQNQFEVMELQLQQLTNGGLTNVSQQNNSINDQNEALLQKIATLELQLKTLQKERDQINSHYEHYVGELNEQVRTMVMKNEELTKEIQNLSNRENSLIDQISDMEIRLQNYNRKETVETNVENTKSNDAEIDELKKKYTDVQNKLHKLSTEYTNLQKKYEESESKIAELSQSKDTECNHDNISLTKLNADITSDKIAAQRATEQNKKLKTDMQELEEAFVKMTRDKLELTEKLAAEKYLNRELTIKLAEIEEKAKDMHIKLMAKDEEMIRLQTSYRDMEKSFEKMTASSVQSTDMNNDNESYIIEPERDTCSHSKINVDDPHENLHTCHETEHQHLLEAIEEKHNSNLQKKDANLQKEDAMIKLQDRFLKIMEEVADLSDEKHRLEHIILQLQNETDTICEYVALYQQQRSLLKKRDEERSAQMKIFQAECDRLKRELDELSGILVRFAEDKQLSSYFEIESKQNDLAKVMDLLANLKNNSLIDPRKKSVDFKNFYPCSCCSGQLIEV